MVLRRWFARAYHQPPNHPLFAQETLTYWRAHLVADNLQETQQLQALLDTTPPATSPQSQAWRSRVQARLRDLGAKVDAPADDQLALDLAAAERGEMPEFLRRRMSAPMPGALSG